MEVLGGSQRQVSEPAALRLPNLSDSNQSYCVARRGRSKGRDSAAADLHSIAAARRPYAGVDEAPDLVFFAEQAPAVVTAGYQTFCGI